MSGGYELVETNVGENARVTLNIEGPLDCIGPLVATLRDIDPTVWPQEYMLGFI